MGKARAAKLLRRAERDRWMGVNLWHGGVPGLGIGESLLAPADQPQMPLMSTPRFLAEARADRVYFTTDIDLARVFAAAVFDAYGDSAVYRVRPTGPTANDIDLPNVSFHARSAQIVEVSERGVSMTPLEKKQMQARYQTWDDGRPMYDSSGRIQITRQLEALGMTQQDLNRRFPIWTDPRVMSRALSAELKRRDAGYVSGN